MTTRAVLFDLGNTLVSYYTSAEFPVVLRQCLEECVSTLGVAPDNASLEDLFERAMVLNQEKPDYAVRPLRSRLEALFGASQRLDDTSFPALVTAFMKPILSVARLDPQALPVLEKLRSLGIKTAIVSNSPWGTPASVWREELVRHGLLDNVDGTVFCGEVGWRKPHRAPFDRALSLLNVAPSEAVFVGDHPKWDAEGARDAGLRAVLLGSEPIGDYEVISELRDIIALVAPAMRR